MKDNRDARPIPVASAAHVNRHTPNARDREKIVNPTNPPTSVPIDTDILEVFTHLQFQA